MSIIIREVSSKKDLIKFIKFPFSLYRKNSYYVPPIIDFELSTLDPSKNPAFDHSKARYWMAYRNEEIVGRIAGIILNEELKKKSLVRFGWIDFIDELEVSTLLLEKVMEWGKHHGASKIHGPLGFTDFDFEGMLISGFDQLATQATIYNYPYYSRHLENFSFGKAVDWIEIRGKIPNEVPKKVTKTASIVTSRFNFRVKKFKKSREIKKYAADVLKVFNKSYDHLYGYHTLTESQIDYYIKQYFGFLRTEFVSIVLNEKEEVIGAAVLIPSLSKAFQKARGRLYPFGFIHILQDFRSNKHMDALLIGVLPEYQKLGAMSLIFNSLFHSFVDNGVEYCSTGPMLEENLAVLNIWQDYKIFLDDVEIRRRCFIRDI